MGSSEIAVGELLYEATVEFTDVIEYGVSLGGVLAGNYGYSAGRCTLRYWFSGLAAWSEIERNNYGR